MRPKNIMALSSIGVDLLRTRYYSMCPNRTKDMHVMLNTWVLVNEMIGLDAMSE